MAPHSGVRERWNLKHINKNAGYVQGMRQALLAETLERVYVVCSISLYSSRHSKVNLFSEAIRRAFLFSNDTVE